VNWFRKNDAGEFLWPGFGDNSRVLEWIFERCEGTAKARETAIGLLPAEDSLDLSGLDLDDEDISDLLSVDVEGWLAEIPQVRDHYARFGDRLPPELTRELDELEQALRDS
jgi:phosphoenolpyruvate carboxykinase (GTP)